ncbi:capsid protein [Crucivirus-372]|nr:capsid protein [Crucivirus-372]
MPKRRTPSTGPYRPRRRTSAPKRRRPYYSNRRLGAYRGRGAYAAPKSAQIGADLGGYLGSAVGLIPGGKAFSGIASMAGSKIGGFLGNKVGKYMGWGAYKVRSNSLMVPEGNSPAQMHTSGNYVRVSHREYVGDVIAPGNGSSTFQTYQLNPGNSVVFPWLSSQALSYQKYKLLGAIWEFKSTTGNFSTATTANPNVGEVVMSTNYNCADPPFTNRNAMENTQYCSSAKPSTSFVHIIECDPSLQAQENLYIAEGAAPRPQMSINEANWCQTTVATLGTQITNGSAPFQLGSLYITYDVLLIQPIDRSASVAPTSTYSNLGLDVTEPFPLGNYLNIVANPANSINVVIRGKPGDATLYNTISMPETGNGCYYFIYRCFLGTSGAWAAPAFTNLTNCALLSDYDFNTLPLNWQAPINGAVTTSGAVAIGIRVTGPAPSMRFGGGDIPNGANMSLLVTQIDLDLNGQMP